MKKLDESGAALLFWLIAATILVMVVSAITQMRSNTPFNGDQAAALRNTLIHNIHIYATTPRSMYLSSQQPLAASGNQMLKNCLAGPSCTAVGNPYSFVLYDGNSTAVTGIPLYYGLDGSTCGTPSASTNCFLSVSTTLNVACAGACTNPSNVSFTVTYTVSNALSGGQPVLVGLGGLLTSVVGTTTSITATSINTNGH